MHYADPNKLGNADRLKLLKQLTLLKLENTAAFDRLSRIAAQVLGVPTSAVTTVDENHQFFLGAYGINERYAMTRTVPISHSICQHVIADQAPLIISDTREAPLTIGNLAIDDDVIAYLGIPLVTSDGISVGAFCVIDSKPRQWSEQDVSLMTELAAIVLTEIELRSELQRRQDAEHLLEETICKAQQIKIVKQMSQSISHDLRHPISSVSIKVDLIVRRNQDEDIAKQLAYVREKLNDVTNILNNFTLLWSTDTTLSLGKQTVHIHGLLSGIIDYLVATDAYDSGNAIITTDFYEGDAIIHGQPHMLTVMFNSIIENSLIFRAEDAPTVHISTRANDSFIEITIEDNGRGIDEDDLPQIFNPLFKANKARTVANGSSGLGLTIAQQIATEHDGSIHVESKLGVGTRIKVLLPLITDI